MDAKSVVEWWKSEAEKIFREAVVHEFYGFDLFEVEEQDPYFFSDDESGDAVWLVDSRSQGKDYQVIYVEEARKLARHHQVIPRIVSFRECVGIDSTLLEDKKTGRIEKKLKEGGRSFGQKLNRAFMEVLDASILERTNLRILDDELGKTLAQTTDELAKESIRLDRFVFPEHFKGRLLQQGFIVRDDEIKNTHYVGKTVTGLYAFCSSELSEDRALTFDSSKCVALTKESEFYLVPKLRPFVPGVCGRFFLNPIVKDTRAIVAFEGVEQALSSQMVTGASIMHESEKLTVLLLSADPSDATRLRLGQEFRDIREKLQLARGRGKFALEIRTAVRPGDLTQTIFDTEPQIVHFAGHGTTTGDLCLENDEGKIQTVPPDALASLFELVANQVQCVILNTCYSQAQAKAIAQHIDYVIGMKSDIVDKAAITFAIGFYKALGAEWSIEDAYKFGLVELKLMSIPQHLIPVLIEKDS